MNRSLLNIALVLICIAMVGWLLVVGRNLLVPFAIAIIVWYVIDTLASAINHNPFGITVARWLTIPLSIIIITVAAIFLLNLIRQNLSDLTNDAPIYQDRLKNLLEQFFDTFKISDPDLLQNLLPQINIGKLATGLASITSNFLSSLGLILIYVLFLLIEQSAIDGKFNALFPKKAQAQVVAAVQEKIADSIRHYVGIKTAVSLVTACTSYIILTLIGVKYAVLFAVIIFLLNYIPTIGSLIGVLFPSILALLQFDSIWPFIAVVALLGAVQFVIGNLLEPRLMGNTLNLSPLVILLSLSLWGSIWGVTGMVLCVPLTVMMLIICAQFQSSRPIAVLLSANGDVGQALTNEKGT